MPTYNPDAKPPAGNKSAAEDGDYILRVVEFSAGLSKGSKTGGCPAYWPTLAIEKPDGTIDDRFWNIEPQLTDDSSRGAESNQVAFLQNFVLACGIALAANQDFEFFTDANPPSAEDMAAKPNCKWINPVGLRCHARIAKKEFTRKDNTKGFSNEVKTWYVDRPMLPRVEGTTDEVKEDLTPF